MIMLMWTCAESWDCGLYLQVHLKIWRCGMIANEETLSKRLNNTEINSYTTTYGLRVFYCFSLYLLHYQALRLYNILYIMDHHIVAYYYYVCMYFIINIAFKGPQSCLWHIDWIINIVYFFYSFKKKCRIRY